MKFSLIGSIFLASVPNVRNSNSDQILIQIKGEKHV